MTPDGSSPESAARLRLEEARAEATARLAERRAELEELEARELVWANTSAAVLLGALLWAFLSALGILWRVYMPLATPTYLAYGLVSVSYHWNNFLWPLIVTNSVSTRPVTVGLSIFSATDSGTEWSVINAATLLTSGPLLLAFLLFQRQFVQSFMRAGIK